MRRLAWTLSVFASLALSISCQKPPDPLAEQRAVCRALEQNHQLRAGLAVDECAQKLKETADLNDPARKAVDLVDRVVQLAVTGRQSERAELRDALDSLQGLGRPAVTPALSRLLASPDSNARLALARVLVGICGQDCAERKFDCIVPALLEGTGDDRPPEARREAERGLMRCTGEQFGDDPAAWRKWWSDRSAQASR
jgi:HEAT repeat protein